jgi:phosphoribosylglycinamide formyltransferase-1
LRAFPQRVLNIHPALLPAFPGLESWRQALDYGVKVAGCTVHFVDQGIDTGPIVVQRCVPVLDGDTPASLHARIQDAERAAYPEAIATVLQGRITVEGRRVVRRPA